MLTSFLRHRGVGVTLQPGNNYLQVNGSVGSCSASDAMTITYDPELVQSKNKGMPDDLSCQGNPINTAVGNKYQVESDYTSEGAVSLNFERFYNSLDGYWRHNFSTHLAITARSIRLVHADGRESVFSRSGDLVTSAQDEFGQLKYINAQWVYISDNEETFQFDSRGRLTRWENMYGQGYNLTYSTDKTITVTSDHGKVISFTQDQDFQPLNLSTDEGTVTFHYDNQRRLLKVSSLWKGSSFEKQYLYENVQYPRFLTGIVDEEGNRYASWTYDAKGRATSSFHGNGAEKVTVTYNDNGTTTVTNALGKQTTYHYKVVQGVRKVTQIDGQPSQNCPASNASYTYNDRGLISSKIDENQNLTTWQYNDRGLVTTTTEAKGTPEERVTLTEWHPTKRLPTKIIEPTRITELTYSDKGHFLGQKVRSR
ncbi:DUF6531 domain-containing protein [Photobacterium leiognathi]|uniref:DUF6531 domain-containing protein n=1 Tax=Photobacterium leiognathi TaxID=553611 RepID=UPI002739B459|nr:DUF6531 domain-containing protein [Photobacterium leiognathi]